MAELSVNVKFDKHISIEKNHRPENQKFNWQCNQTVTSKFTSYLFLFYLF